MILEEDKMKKTVFHGLVYLVLGIVGFLTGCGTVKVEEVLFNDEKTK